MKPFIVELDYSRGDLGKPHWAFYSTGWGLVPLGFVCLISAFFVQEASAPLSLFGMLVTFVGYSLLHLGRFVREAKSKQDEMTKLAAEQAERIRKLEEQVAALAAATPAHEHAA